jgi:type II secretory pathway component PulF
LFRTLLQSSYFGAGEFWNNDRVSEISPLLLVSLYLPVLVLGLVTCLVVAGLAIPRLRQFLRWRLPGFKESSLSLSASTMRMLLDSGRPLNHALGILQQVENSTPAGADLACWQKRLAAGHAKFSDLALGSRTFPPLFVWLVGQAGEDLATGFGRAAEIYYARAMHRIEMLLYAVLPVSILLLGMLIVGQVLPAFRCFTWMVEPLGDLGGGD